MSLYRNDIRDAIIQAISIYGTLAGSRVYQPDDWPTTTVQLPAILVNAPHERKESVVRGVPSYLATATIVAIGRVSGTAQREVQAEIEMLCEQIEIAVLTDQQIPQMVNQFSSIETQVVLTSEGKMHIAEATIAFAAEFPLVYAPVVNDVLTEIQGTVTNGATGKPLATFDVKLPQN